MVKFVIPPASVVYLIDSCDKLVPFMTTYYTIQLYMAFRDTLKQQESVISHYANEKAGMITDVTAIRILLSRHPCSLGFTGRWFQVLTL